MIDQLPSAVPQASRPVNSARRDRQQASVDEDSQSGNFEDIVSKAGQRQSREAKSNSADTNPSALREHELEAPVEASPKLAFDLSVSLRGVGASAQSQGKLAGRDPAKAADRADQSSREAEAANGRLLEKLKHSAKQADRITQRVPQGANDGSAEAERPLTPSDELGLLLGLTTTRDAEARQDKKSVRADKTENEDASDSHADKIAAKADVPQTGHLPNADAKLGDHRAPAPNDDGSDQKDVVRLVGANGRGRPVEIEVSPASEAPQNGSAWPAATPKFETATVLEARRYLGFTPEPNAVVLATAIKADPTWTEALQAAAGAEPGALGNTVTEVNTLKLQMNPDNLGSMVASLKLKGEELTVELRVDSVEAYQQLTADHDDIVQALQDQGFSIDKVTVQLNATDRTDTSADRDMARQGQPQREGQAQQREEQGGQSGRHDGRPDRQSGWSTSGRERDHASGNGRAEPAPAGDIYL